MFYARGDINCRSGIELQRLTFFAELDFSSQTLGIERIAANLEDKLFIFMTVFQNGRVRFRDGTCPAVGEVDVTIGYKFVG